MAGQLRLQGPIGMDDVALLRAGGAGAQQLGNALDLDEADAARAVDGSALVEAERGDLDARASGGREDGIGRLGENLHTVERVRDGHGSSPPSLPDLDRAEAAGRPAVTALDAQRRVDLMRALAHAGDGLDRALARAGGATHAHVLVDRVRDERTALARRAALVADVRLELVAEVADGGEHRVGRGLAEAAERAILDGVAELLELLDIALLAPAVNDSVEDLEQALVADTAGNALAAALLGREVEEEAGHTHHAACRCSRP